MSHEHLNSVSGSKPPITIFQNSAVTYGENSTANVFNLPRLPKVALHQKPWNTPPKNKSFTGRQQLLNDIQEQLQNSNEPLVLMACHGLGGVGKTQLVRQFLEEHHAEFKGVCWFQGDNLQSEYVKLGNELNLFSDEKLKIEERVHLVKTWLENHPGWLLIYDDVAKYEDIEDLLPAQGNGKILITSRHTEWQGKKISVDVFTLDEAREYVEKITGITNEIESIDELIKILGALPLALAQACAYIKRNKKNIGNYLKLYQEKAYVMLESKLLPAGDKHDPVAITWNITLDQMKEESPEAVELMYFCAQLHNENIPDYLLNAFFKENDDQISLQMKVDDAKRVASEYSMIKINENLISLHCLTQEVIKVQFNQDNNFFYLRKSMDALISNFDSLYNDTIEDISKKRELLQHFEAILKNRDKFLSHLTLEEDDKQLKTILLYLSNIYLILSNAYKAKDLLERALLISEKYYGKEHVETAITLRGLGTAYGNLGNSQKEKDLLERALIILENHYGKEHTETATTLSNLGIAYGALGNSQKQKELFERALLILEKYYGKGHVETARVLTNLGIAYTKLGDVQKSKEFFKRALLINRNHYGIHHFKTAITLTNLSNSYGHLGNAQKQKKLIEWALLILENHYGKDHFETANALISLGSAYGCLGDTQKSKEIFERALIIKENYYGKEHVQTAVTLTNLGTAYGTLGDGQKSKEILERALIINENYYGKEHVETAITLRGLGTAYGTLGDGQKSKEILERALLINENYYGKEHIQTAITLARLGVTYSALGDDQKSKEILERALIILENHCGKENVEISGTLHNLGNAYGALGDTRKQKEILEHALLINEKHYGKEHIQTAAILNDLSIAYHTLRDAQKSKELLERALPIFENYYGKEHVNTARVLVNLANTYDALGDAQKSKELLECALPIFKVTYGANHPHAIKLKEDLKKLSLLGSVYNFYQKIKLKEDSSLISFLKAKSALQFFGMRDESYKVDAVVEISTEESEKAAKALQQGLNGYGQFFKFNEENIEKKGFVLEGINIPSENNEPSVGTKIQNYLRLQ